MSDLRSALGEAVGAAFAAGPAAPNSAGVTPSDRPDLADFQCNGALAAAKAAGAIRARSPSRSPRGWPGDPRLGAVAWPAGLHQPAGQRAGPRRARQRPGRRSARRRHPWRRAAPGAGRLRRPQRRQGDARRPPARLDHRRGDQAALSFRGDEVLGDAHFGDWGFQMGLLIVAALDADPAIAARCRGEAAGRRGPRRRAGRSPISLDDLDRLYPAAAARAKTDPAYRDRARRATAELQAGRPATGCSGATSPPSPALALERDFHALASISTSGRARATSTR
jgi:arginyl-tRNA synthetase